MARSTPMRNSLHLDHGLGSRCCIVFDSFQRSKLYSQYLRKLHAKLEDFWVYGSSLIIGQIKVRGLIDTLQLLYLNLQSFSTMLKDIIPKFPTMITSFLSLITFFSTYFKSYIILIYLFRSHGMSFFFFKDSHLIMFGTGQVKNEY